MSNLCIKNKHLSSGIILTSKYFVKYRTFVYHLLCTCINKHLILPVPYSIFLMHIVSSLSVLCISGRLNLSSCMNMVSYSITAIKYENARFNTDF